MRPCSYASIYRQLPDARKRALVDPKASLAVNGCRGKVTMKLFPFQEQVVINS